MIRDDLEIIVFQLYIWFQNYCLSHLKLFLFHLKLFLFHLKLIGKILTSRPGDEHIMQEYGKTKSLTDATRRQMINILAAEMTETHG